MTSPWATHSLHGRFLVAFCACLVAAQVGPEPGQVPRWPVTYQMNRSTVIMPCNGTGPTAPSTTTGWGLISFDWSNWKDGKDGWAPAKPMDCEEKMLAQAKVTKDASPTTRVWVYRNSIKALPWFTTVRKTLEDPAYAPWFLRFNCTNETRPFANCTLVQNVDYDRGSSGPLPDVPATSAADCCAQCAAYPGCWAATFPAGQQRCYFKTENQSKVPSYNDGAVGCWPAGHTPPPDPNAGCHVPRCDANYEPPLCSEYYHDQSQTPNYPSGDGTCTPPACDVGSVPVGEYIWDPRAANISVNGQTFIRWYIDDYLFGATGAGSPLIDGFFFDDQWTATGPTEFEAHVVQDLGLRKPELLVMTAAFEASQRIINREIVNRSKFSWQLFDDDGTTCARPLVKKASCAADLARLCAPGSVAQTQAIMYAFSPGGCGGDPAHLADFDADLANFLLVRGDYAWLGNAWLGCSRVYAFPPALNADYGVPLGLCAESAPGVWTRAWSRATVSMNCSSWTPTIRVPPTSS